MLGIEWVCLSFVDPAVCVLEVKKLPKRKPQNQSGRYHRLTHKCQKYSECKEKLPEGNRGLKLSSNLYTGQGEVGTDLMGSFGSWGYERSTCNFGGLFIG